MATDKKIMKYRQGDVGIYEVSSIPKGAIKIKDKTLAYGEFTGHSHRFEHPEFIERYEYEGKKYLQVIQADTLYHEEHNPIIIEPGMYEQIEEREYDPFVESTRTVLD